MTRDRAAPAVQFHARPPLWPRIHSTYLTRYRRHHSQVHLIQSSSRSPQVAFIRQALDKKQALVSGAVVISSRSHTMVTPWSSHPDLTPRSPQVAFIRQALDKKQALVSGAVVISSRSHTMVTLWSSHPDLTPRSPQVAFIRQALDKKQALLSGAVEKQRAWQNRKGMVTHEVALQMTEVNKLQGEVRPACGGLW